jgi:hypothetical protein
MASLILGRRALLRGLGGVAIALPALEVMFDGKWLRAGPPPAIPTRYLVCFNGQSLGGDDDPLVSDYVPDKVGPGYDLKSALAPLSTVQGDVSVVSGMRIPSANGGAVPAGGRDDDFHISSLSALFSGVRSGPAQTVMGPTSDQLVADAIGTTTTFKSLVYRVQAAWYLSVAAPYGRDLMSYKPAGAGALPTPIPATVSPRQAFDSLFSGFVPPDNAAAQKQADFELRQRKSILDLVDKRSGKLLSRLGVADKARLQNHLDEIRDLERRVAAIPPVAQGACQKPGDPGPDPPLGGNQGSTFDQNLGYSGEEERAKVFCDLICMAFVCDLTRVASLMLSMAQSHLNMFALTGQASDLHEIGHHGLPGADVTLQMSKAIAWHVKHFAYLIGKLRDTKEGSGTVLDNTVAVLLHEGGHGYDPASGKQWSSHSTENMACLIAGHAGGLRPGKHVVATDKHPANVLVSAMNAAGVSATSLGEVSGRIDELFA